MPSILCLRKFISIEISFSSNSLVFEGQTAYFASYCFAFPRCLSDHTRLGWHKSLALIPNSSPTIPISLSTVSIPAGLLRISMLSSFRRSMGEGLGYWVGTGQCSDCELSPQNCATAGGALHWCVGGRGRPEAFWGVLTVVPESRVPLTVTLSICWTMETQNYKPMTGRKQILCKHVRNNQVDWRIKLEILSKSVQILTCTYRGVRVG